jgi:hypothetical protein
MPAQLTTIRNGPSAVAASTAACTPASLVTSAGTKTADFPGLPSRPLPPPLFKPALFKAALFKAALFSAPLFSSSANAAPAEDGRSTSTTVAPSSNSLRAVAAPRPEAPPVTSATLPVTSIHPP